MCVVAPRLTERTTLWLDVMAFDVNLPESLLHVAMYPRAMPMTEWVVHTAARRAAPQSAVYRVFHVVMSLEQLADRLLLDVRRDFDLHWPQLLSAVAGPSVAEVKRQLLLVLDKLKASRLEQERRARRVEKLLVGRLGDVTVVHSLVTECATGNRRPSKIKQQFPRLGCEALEDRDKLTHAPSGEGGHAEPAEMPNPIRVAWQRVQERLRRLQAESALDW